LCKEPRKLTVVVFVKTAPVIGTFDWESRAMDSRDARVIAQRYMEQVCSVVS